MRLATLVGLVVVCGLVCVFPRPGPAASPDQDLVTGIKAGLMTVVLNSNDLAQQGGVLAAVNRHLQHTINCLEGRTGLHFRPDAGDLCQGKGHGIIPDLQEAVSLGVPGAEKALKDATIAWSLAMKAMAMTDVNEAQPWARVAAKYLKMASDDLSR